MVYSQVTILKTQTFPPKNQQFRSFDHSDASKVSCGMKKISSTHFRPQSTVNKVQDVLLYLEYCHICMSHVKKSTFLCGITTLEKHSRRNMYFTMLPRNIYSDCWTRLRQRNTFEALKCSIWEPNTKKSNLSPKKNMSGKISFNQHVALSLTEVLLRRTGRCTIFAIFDSHLPEK